MLPKYFADTDKVEDLESRLVTCMVTLQGFTPEQAKKDPFGGPGKKVAMDALVAYITSASRGMKMNVVGIAIRRNRKPTSSAREIFFYRGGPHDFALRHLPRRRTTPAHPPAGPAEPHQDRGRAARLRHAGRRIASRRARCARSSGG